MPRLTPWGRGNRDPWRKRVPISITDFEMIHFFLIVNRQGFVRIRRNYVDVDEKERKKRDTLVIGECLKRNNKQCSFFHVENFAVVYRRFTALTFICGVSKEENELAIQELLNAFMDCLLEYFHNISELDIVHNMGKVYMILDEVIVNGCAAYTSKERALLPLHMFDADS